MGVGITVSESACVRGIEEIGWRYTFQPVIERMVSYIPAVLITFLCWGIWYFLFFYIDGSLASVNVPFFLPGDFGEFCVGCANCFTKTEKKCPNYVKLAPITEAMDAADVIILASPVYVFHATGAGTKSTNKDMADSLFFWGIAKI